MCVAYDEKRKREVFKMKTASWELCVLGRWRRDAGKVVQRDDARLGVGRGGDWRLIYRY